MDPIDTQADSQAKVARQPAAAAPLPPHAPLAAYYGDAADRRRFLTRIFDDTAPDYDRIERLLALGTGPWYRRMALQRAGLAQGAQVLDVGIGTGLLAREALSLIGPAGRLVGVDPSPGMMGQVRLPGVDLRQGRAEALPCADASCDFLSMGYALRHIDDLAAAFAEFRRVLRPGGRLVLLEISRPRSALASKLLKAYMRVLVPVLARLVARQGDTSRLWEYYWDTIEACVPPERIVVALQQAGFVDVDRYVELGIFSEYRGRVPG